MQAGGWGAIGWLRVSSAGSEKAPDWVIKILIKAAGGILKRAADNGPETRPRAARVGPRGQVAKAQMESQPVIKKEGTCVKLSFTIETLRLPRTPASLFVSISLRTIVKLALLRREILRLGILRRVVAFIRRITRRETIAQRSLLSLSLSHTRARNYTVPRRRIKRKPSEECEVKI